MAPPGGHYVRPNESSRIPRRHIILDTEACFDHLGPVQMQTWRLGVAEFCDWDDRRGWTVERRGYDTPEQLWKDVDAFTVPRRRTVLWAHNVSYDLRTSDALARLAALDWALKDIRLSGRGTWATWRRGSASLAAVDSASVWPVPLATLATTLGLGKVALPRGDDHGAWMARCVRDVEILGTAVRLYLDWLRTEDMGTWQMTGAGQSWGHWRHKHMTHKILVADKLDARDVERRAMWTGRTEAWTWGTDMTAMVYDYDFECAYATITSNTDVPTGQHSAVKVKSLDTLLRWTGRFRVLAEVEVQTDVPVVPTESDGRIVWPVGTFSTVLWDPELSLLSSNGATVTPGRAWLYRRAPALREWSKTLLDSLARPDSEVPGWQKLILKNWSRTLIGRFAMQYQGWEDFGTTTEKDLRIIDGHDLTLDEPFRLLQIGGQLLSEGELSEGRDSAPFVTGYVMSKARARLWHAVEVIGSDHVLYMDTDSLLLDAAGHQIVQDNTGHPGLAGLRVKRRFRGYSIAGPRQLVVGGEARMAGVPRNSVRTGEWDFRGEVWRSLGESIRAGESDRVRVSSRTFRVQQVDRRRTRLDNGRTAPIQLEKG